jgi:methionine synthase I (cobalamin-dependent)
MSRLLDALDSGRVVLMDGAMYTELHGAGLPENECAELWNLRYPDKVRAVHQRFVEAGAEVLLTNTFQANPAALGKHGHQSRIIEINEAAVVLASMGPADALDPDAVRVMVGSLRAADGLLLETQSNTKLLEAVLPVSGALPVLFSFTFLRNAAGIIVTQEGLTPEDCARSVRGMAIGALGVNCGREIGMQEIIEIVKRYRGASDLPVFARPNAGTPTVTGDQWLFPHGAEEMAERIPELREAGVAMVGGCCGTTAGHIAAFRAALQGCQA